jgi:hypothetical protein
MIYAVLNSEGKCINRVVWNGDTSIWSPPEGCTAVCDDDCCHPIENERPPVIESNPEEEVQDFLNALSPEQKQALISLLSQQ